MSTAVWRKKNVKSSTKYAGEKSATEVDERVIFRAAVRIATLGAMMSYSSQTLADAKHLEQIIPFDIPQQRADLSLTEFAEQADITLIFPFDDAMEVTANNLIGEYSIEEAVYLLLANTGLRIKVSEDGQLTITTDQSLGEIDPMHKKNKLSSAIVGVLSSLVGAQAFAQNSGVAEEEVIVTGIRASLQKSMDVKRESGGVVDAISAEDIGKFPDTNLAESLQRITGVSIDRSGGEGQSITVRGFGPSFNAVVVNGRRLASESETRGFSFDTIASEMVSGLEVYKSSEATLPSGGVGATVNINTARPFDIDGFKLAGSIKANYEENSEETTPQFSALISNTFADDSVGVLLSVQHSERDTRIDQAQTDQWIENPTIPDGELLSGPTPVFAAQNFDQRVLFEERTRTNANLVLQFAPSENLTITGDILYSDFDVEGDAFSMGHWFTPSNFDNVTTDENGTIVSFNQATGQATDFHAKTADRLTETTSYGLNFDWNVNDNLNLQFDLWRSESEREVNNGNNNNMVLGSLRGSSYLNDGSTLPVVSNFENIVGDNDQGYLNPANPRAHVSIRGGQATGRAVNDEVDEFKIAGIWDEGSDTGLVKAKFGLGITNETREVDAYDNTTDGTHAIYAGYLDVGTVVQFDSNGDGVTEDFTAFDIPDSEFSVFNAGGDFLDGVSGSGRMPTSWLRVDGERIFDLFEQQSGVSHDAKRTGASFSVEEEIFFGYVELDFAGEIADMPLTATAGVRIENTDVTVDSTDVPLESLTVIDQTEFGRTFQDATSVSTSNDYESLLPNFSAKLDITDNLVSRFAASRTLTRPTLSAMPSVTNIVTTRPGGNLTARVGNPDLVPFESDNLDLSVEYYFGDTSYASIGYFQKNVVNFIVDGASTTQFFDSNGDAIEQPAQNSDGVFSNDPGSPTEEANFTVTSPTNGATAKLDGIEIAVQHSFDSGLGFLVNGTFVNSDAELDINDLDQTFALPGLSDSYNAVAFYENGPFAVRLAYTWRDEFLQGLTQSAGASEPVFVEEYEQFDLSGSYDITEEISVFLEVINLTEEIVVKHGRYDNQFLNADDSGRRMLFGVRASF